MDNLLKSASIGKKLRRARLEKRMRLPELQEVTKIQSNYLKQMERGDFGFFPKPIMIGFIKSYASALDLDPDPLVKQLEEVHRTMQIKKQDEEQDATKAKSVESPASKPLFEQTREESLPGQMQEPALSQPGEQIEKPTASNLPLASKSKDRENWFKSHQSETILGALVLLIVCAIVFVYFRYSGQDLSEESQPVEKITVFEARQQNLDEAVSETPEIEPIRIPETVKLRVVAAETTWVQMIRDEVDTSEFIFQPGNDRSFEADNQFELRLGRADGLIFWVNSDSVGRMGSASEIVSRLVITNRGITEKRVRPPISLAQ